MCPSGEIARSGEVGVLIDVDEEASFLNPSLPECFMPESKSMIMIIHNPCWHSSIFQKYEMLESFSRCHFTVYFSLNHRLCSCDDIIESSCDETWHNESSITTLIEIEAIIRYGFADNLRIFIHTYFTGYVYFSTIIVFPLVRRWQ
jgi:hypothetical protein